jgi:hypothetical protein
MSTIVFRPLDFVVEAEAILRQRYPAWCAEHAAHLERAVCIVKAGKVARWSQFQFNVQSDQGGLERGMSYLVDQQVGACSCADFRIHRGPCKHRIAVYLFVQCELLYREWLRWELAMDASEAEEMQAA